MESYRDLQILHQLYDQSRSTEDWLDKIYRVLPLNDQYANQITAAAELVDGFQISSSFLEKVSD